MTTHGNPPESIDAEQSVISTMLLDRSAIDKLMLHGFRAEHCYADANRWIVETIYEMYERGSVIDLVTLAAALLDKGKLVAVGGKAYLMMVSDATPFVANVLEHASIVIEKWRVRETIKICQLGAARGYGPIENAQTYLEDLEVQIAELAHAGRRANLEPVGKVLVDTVSQIAEMRQAGAGVTQQTIPTGITELDRMLGGGLFRGNVYVVGARPGMGKTAFLNTILTNVSCPKPGPQGTPVASYASALFSLEMPRKQMAARFATQQSAIPMNAITSGNLYEKDWQKLLEVSTKMRYWPIWIDDTASLGLGELRALIRQLKRRLVSRAVDEPNNGSLGAVAIDYLQLMKGVRGRGASREEEIASLSRGLKEIAKEEDVPIVVASQLNRNVEKNGKDKRPSLADLRESGAIEQDADAVAFLYREFYYDKAADRGEAEIILAKQRNGPTGTVTTLYKDSEMRFYNLAPAADEDFFQDEYWDQ